MSWSGSYYIGRLRNQVISAYGSTCWLCGLPIDLALPRTHPQGFTVDHVVPRSKGGTDVLSNLRPAHWICNVRRQDKPGRPHAQRRALARLGWPGFSE